MKKLFIGSLIGGIILFIWSFLAWAVTPMHLHTYMYTPLQDSLLQMMASSNMETGAYAMPMVDNRNVTSMDKAYMEKCDALMKSSVGKPAATLYYSKEMAEFNAMTLVRGFIFEFLTVFCICILLMPAFAASSSFFGRWWLTLVVGLLISLTGPLMNWNFMGAPWSFTVDMIVDIFLNMAIVGLWLAWYFRR